MRIGKQKENSLPGRGEEEKRASLFSNGCTLGAQVSGLVWQERVLQNLRENDSIIMNINILPAATKRARHIGSQESIVVRHSRCCIV